MAGLTLNSIKCVIVPLKPFSAECAADVKDWLARKLSEWSSFKIQPTAKYLGFWLGPSVTFDSWIDPLKKWRCRGVGIAAKQASPIVTAHQYNSRAVPCLQYVAQLIPLPCNTRKLEACTINSVLHLPPSSLSLGAAVRLCEFGGPKIASINVSALAARVRCANSTVPHWPRLLEQAKQTHQNKSCINGVFSEQCYPPHWQSDSFVINLNMAAKHSNITVTSIIHDTIDKLSDNNKHRQGMQKKISTAIIRHVHIHGLSKIDPDQSLHDISCLCADNRFGIL